MSQSERIEAELKRIRASFAQELPGKLAEVTAILNRVSNQEEIGPDALGAAALLLHSLAGTGKMFGFPAVSETARLLEIELELLDAKGPPLTLARRTRINTMLDALVRAAANAPDD